jgi:uncharacterized protein (TIGR01244 family)
MWRYHMTWINYSSRIAISLLSAVVVLTSLISASFAESAQVPFGDKISSVIFNYNRTTPFIATSGRVNGAGILELKSLGFKTILDLRTAPEGTAEEQNKAITAGLNYYNIPISRAEPKQDQIRKFASLVENRNNYPMLVHCASANRVGAMWTLYRVSKGIAFKHAVQEGRTIGLKPKRENQVRKMLGEPLL